MQRENNPNGGVHPSGVPELTTQKQEEFLNALRASIEFFVNRMQSDSQRGRSIANDTTVQALFLTLHEMHPQLLQQKQSMEDRRGKYLFSSLGLLGMVSSAMDSISLRLSFTLTLEIERIQMKYYLISNIFLARVSKGRTVWLFRYLISLVSERIVANKMVDLVNKFDFPTVRHVESTFENYPLDLI